jgi:hypothetical protein
VIEQTDVTVAAGVLLRRDPDQPQERLAGEGRVGAQRHQEVEPRGAA